MRFAREIYSDRLVNEMLPLWDLHALETLDSNPMELAPNLDVYKAMEAMGSLRVYTMRQGERLVGYQVIFVTTHHHSRNVLIAQTDILFLHPEHRRGLTAYRFMKWCDEQIASEGIAIAIKAFKAKSHLGHLLERMGYVTEDISYSRRLVCQ